MKNGNSNFEFCIPIHNMANFEVLLKTINFITHTKFLKSEFAFEGKNGISNLLHES